MLHRPLQLSGCHGQSRANERGPSSYQPQLEPDGQLRSAATQRLLQQQFRPDQYREAVFKRIGVPMVLCVHACDDYKRYRRFSSGSANINANTTSGLTVALRRPYPRTLRFSGTRTPAPEQRLRLAYTNSSQVPPHRITWNGIWELPFGRGKKIGGNSNWGTNALIGGWQIAFIGSWNGGYWMGVPSTEFIAKNPSFKQRSAAEHEYLRPKPETLVRRRLRSHRRHQRRCREVDRPGSRGSRSAGNPSNRTGFDNRLPQTLANGTVVLTPITDLVSWNARNFMIGPGGWNQDLSLFKYFQFAERVRLRFSADFFNALNHPNDYIPNATTGLIDMSRQLNPPRIIQIGARLEW